MEEGTFNASNPKVVDREHFRLTVNLAGTTNAETQWRLKLKIQFVQFNDTCFAIKICKLQGSQVEMNNVMKELKRAMNSVVLQ